MKFKNIAYDRSEDSDSYLFLSVETKMFVVDAGDETFIGFEDRPNHIAYEPYDIEDVVEVDPFQCMKVYGEDEDTQEEALDRINEFFTEEGVRDLEAFLQEFPELKAIIKKATR